MFEVKRPKLLKNTSRGVCGIVLTGTTPRTQHQTQSNPFPPKAQEANQPPMGGSEWGGLLGQEVGALLPTEIRLLNMATSMSHQ